MMRVGAIPSRAASASTASVACRLLYGPPNTMSGASICNCGPGVMASVPTCAHHGAPARARKVNNAHGKSINCQWIVRAAPFPLRCHVGAAKLTGFRPQSSVCADERGDPLGGHQCKRFVRFWPDLPLACSPPRWRRRREPSRSASSCRIPGSSRTAPPSSTTPSSSTSSSMATWWPARSSSSSARTPAASRPMWRSASRRS